MPNRRLTVVELEQANAILQQVRAQLDSIAAGDTALHWALRRKVYKELVYDERGKPMHRRRLKHLKREQQRGLCAICAKPLPDKYAVLDRFEAMHGYTDANTRLVCPDCDTSAQRDKGYA